MGQEESCNLKTYLSTVIQDDCLHHLRHSVQLAKNAHDDTEMNRFLDRVHVLGGHNPGWSGGRGHRWDHDPVVAADGVETKAALAARRELSQVRVKFLKSQSNDRAEPLTNASENSHLSPDEPNSRGVFGSESVVADIEETREGMVELLSCRV